MSVRASLKAASAIAKESEQYYLIYWEEENKVSIHKAHEVNLDLEESGVAYVKFKRKQYAGKIAGHGTKAEMVALENEYLDEKIDVANDENCRPHENHDVNETVQDDGNEVKKPKKKRRRKLVNDDKLSMKTSSTADNTCSSKKQKLNDQPIDKKKPKKDKGKKQRGSIIEIACGKDVDSVQDDSESDETTILDDSQDPEKWSTPTKLSSPDKGQRSKKEQMSPHSDKEGTAMDPVKDHKGKIIEPQKKLFWPSDANSGDEQQLGSMREYSKRRFSTGDNWRSGSEIDSWRPSYDSWRPSFAWQGSYRPNYEQTAVTDGRRPNFDRMSLEIKGLADDVLNVNIRLKRMEEKLTFLQKKFQATRSYDENLQYGTSPLLKMATSPSTSTSPSEASSSGTSQTANMSGAVFLKGIDKLKKDNPLPAIDKASLLTPEDVVTKYPKLLKSEKIPTLSVRLAKESFFGKSIMSRCTVRGSGSFHALPELELQALKEYLISICIPRFATSKLDFEIIWKNCVESIGQACKSLRNLLNY